MLVAVQAGKVRPNKKSRNEKFMMLFANRFFCEKARIHREISPVWFSLLSEMFATDNSGCCL
jgi:hypothetical protein